MIEDVPAPLSRTYYTKECELMRFEEEEDFS